MSADPWAEEVRRIDTETDLCKRCEGVGEVEADKHSHPTEYLWCKACKGTGNTKGVR